MNKLVPSKLLKIFVSETDQYNHQPLYEYILHLAMSEGISGATVVKGILSYGTHGRIHTQKILSLSSEMPILIEIISDEIKIMKFVELLDPIFNNNNIGGKIVIQNVEIIRFS